MKRGKSNNYDNRKRHWAMKRRKVQTTTPGENGTTTTTPVEDETVTPVEDETATLVEDETITLVDDGPIMIVVMLKSDTSLKLKFTFKVNIKWLILLPKNTKLIFNKNVQLYPIIVLTFSFPLIVLKHV